MNILFAEDDPDTRTLAVRAVAQEFPDARTIEIADAAGLEDGLCQRIDILVTDFDLRWSDGFDVFSRVKANSPQCVCVMFTGTGNEELAVRAIKSGFDDYVVKSPGQLRRLATSVRRAYERASEKRTLEENREILRRELYHRLHNNLQIIISLIRLTRRSVEDAALRAKLADLEARIQSMSILQEQFYRTDDLQRIDVAAYVRQLVEELAAAHVGSPELDLDPAEVPVDVAVPLALILNELLMIVLAESSSEDRLKVTMSRTNSVLVIRIAGGPLQIDRMAAGELSGELVRRLAQQARASVTNESQTDLAAWRLELPL